MPEPPTRRPEPATGRPGRPRTASSGSLIGRLTISGHGRDREIEADAAALLFLAEADLGTEHMGAVLQKIEAFSPGMRRGPFSSHPDTDARVEALAENRVRPIGASFRGTDRRGNEVASVHLVAQVQRGSEVWIYADIHAAHAIGRRDNINDLSLSWTEGRRRVRVKAKERTAERIEPGGTVAAVFVLEGVDRIPDDFSADLKIRNARRWQRIPH